MKKLLSVILVLTLAFALVACGSSNTDTTPSDTETEEKDLLAQIQERGYIVIATEGDWSPWTYHDEAGTLTGLDVAIGKKIAEKLGVEARFEETDWDSILAGVDSGRFDIACNGVGYTEKRAEKYNFSDPYVYTHKVLVVRADNEDIKTVEDLEGKTTANTASSTYAALAEEYGATVTPVNTLTETIELLVNGRVDATINAQVSINDYLEQHPDANIKVVQVMAGDPVAYPMRKAADTDTLVAAVNDILQELRDSGELAEISKEFFGLDLTQPD